MNMMIMMTLTIEDQTILTGFKTCSGRILFKQSLTGSPLLFSTLMGRFYDDFDDDDADDYDDFEYYDDYYD